MEIVFRPLSYFLLLSLCLPARGDEALLLQIPSHLPTQALETSLTLEALEDGSLLRASEEKPLELSVRAAGIGKGYTRLTEAFPKGSGSSASFIDLSGPIDALSLGLRFPLPSLDESVPRLAIYPSLARMTTLSGSSQSSPALALALPVLGVSKISFEHYATGSSFLLLSPWVSPYLPFGDENDFPSLQAGFASGLFFRAPAHLSALLVKGGGTALQSSRDGAGNLEWGRPALSSRSASLTFFRYQRWPRTPYRLRAQAGLGASQEERSVDSGSADAASGLSEDIGWTTWQSEARVAGTAILKGGVRLGAEALFSVGLGGEKGLKPAETYLGIGGSTFLRITGRHLEGGGSVDLSRLQATTLQEGDRWFRSDVRAFLWLGLRAR